MASSSSNPITSVPDPSQGSALASVITQVQPGQATAARPVRPRKPAQGAGGADGAKKKKKKKKRTDAAEQHTVASGSGRSGAAAGPQEAAVRAAAAAGSSDALRQAHASSSAATGAGSDTATITQPAADNSLGLQATGAGNDADHSHQPSATLVDDSVAGNTLTSADAAAATKAATASGTQPQTQGLDRAAGDLAAKESSEGTVDKDGLISVPTQTKGSSSKTQAAMPSAAKSANNAAPTGATARPGASSTEKAKPKKPSFGQRLVAILTCSSGAQAVADEELNEKRAAQDRAGAGRARTNAKTGGAALPTGVVVPPRTPNSKGGSRLGGDDGNSSIGPTTPGGGTRLPREETGDVMSGAVVPPGASFVAPGDFATPGAAAGAGLGLGTAAAAGAQHHKTRGSAADLSKTESSVDEEYDDDEDEDDEDDDDDLEIEGDYLDDDQTEEQRLIMQGGMGIPVDEFGNPEPLLGPIVKEDHGRKCLVLDLDETLVHSSFKVMPADFIVPVEIEGTVHNVYVIKRPGVDEFMRRMGEIYEVVVFTASLSKYADPVLDMLDIHHAVRHRLFRESCYNHKGNYVKDLSQLGRDIGDTIIIDNSPASYIFHPNNAVPISSWFNDPHDTELTDLCPFLADLCEVDDVRAVLDGGLF